MSRFFRLLGLLVSARAGAARETALRRVGLIVAILLCGLAAAVFGATLVLIALAHRIGWQGALWVAFGAALAGLGLSLWALARENRRHRARVLAAKADQARLVQLAMLTVLPDLRRNAVLIGVIAGLAAVFVATRPGKPDA